MSDSLKDKALRYHEYPHPGKIAVIPCKPYANPQDLSLAYSPGVAYPCLEIKEDAGRVRRYTGRGNLVAVISNGTAVLGLGNIGPLAAKPVMEGKALLFKIYAGLDAFDIELDAADTDAFVAAVKAMAPTFGGINLEDIKAPECFEIERRLREECDIPIMHDDQHGTAIISSAALLNALIIQNKNIGEVKLVVNGAGAAAVACTRLYEALGVRRNNIVMCDSKGVIRADRPGLSGAKLEFATDRDIHTLADALVGADVFLGLSVANVMTPEMLLSMAPKPIVFALANPDPEIDHDLALATRTDLIFATGRSDFSNQINNVLGFPYIFRGALDCDASEINEAMKLAAARAVAALAHEPATEALRRLYPDKSLEFGPKYILPKPFDKRLLPIVATAVARAAAESGVARRPIADYGAYSRHLSGLLDHMNRYDSELMLNGGSELPTNA
ncbi:MAG: malate dehydrogenase [Muribaculaceae bacterium]|nr:malate dehydrogenase [Muribaculaceae bacterium]